jgi:hypothetical protein
MTKPRSHSRQITVTHHMKHSAYQNLANLSAVTLLNYIWKMFHSNVGCDTDYSDSDVPCFFSVPPGKFRGSVVIRPRTLPPDLSELFSYRSVQFFIVYISDDQLAARGPNPARSLIYSGPRQVTGLVRLVKVSISA